MLGFDIKLAMCNVWNSKAGEYKNSNCHLSAMVKFGDLDDGLVHFIDIGFGEAPSCAVPFDPRCV